MQRRSKIKKITNLDRSRDFRNFGPKPNFFQKLWPKSSFSKLWTEIVIFSKIVTELVIFDILNRNRIFFSKILTEIEFFEILNRNRIFSKMLNEIGISEISYQDGKFFKNVDRNRDFRNF